MSRATYDRLCPDCRKLVREVIEKEMEYESCLGIDEGVFVRHAEYKGVRE